MDPSRPPGAHVLLTQTWRDSLWAAMPAVVVRDDADLTALHFPPGTRALGSTSRGLAEREGLSRSERMLTSLATGVWAQREDVLADRLSLFPRDQAWSLSIMWIDGEPIGWKIDAIRPLVATSYGFDSMDLMLDVLIAPDLASWTVKDDDEVALAEARGIVSQAEATAIRRSIEVAVDHLSARRAPFDPAWLAWRPDPSWTVPALPARLPVAFPLVG